MNQSIKTGTATGTLVSLLGAVTWFDIERTIVLGGIGAAVSFLVSFALKMLLDKKQKQ